MDVADYRRTIGHFATGVTVITTAVDGQLHGMTANAVSSLSLEPLLLLACIDKKANCHRQLQACEHFGVNILATDQEAVSNAFAVVQEPQADSLSGVPYRLDQRGVPLIEGCLAHFVCALADQFEAGDHTIFTGRVEDGGIDPHTEPLLFYAGGYRRLAAT